MRRLPHAKPTPAKLNRQFTLQPSSIISSEVRIQDFGGFRTVLLIPRFRPSWPPPNTFTEEAPKKTLQLGAPRGPLPILLPKSKPVSAATVRCGPDFLEVPFFATHDSHRCAAACFFPFFFQCPAELVEQICISGLAASKQQV